MYKNQLLSLAEDLGQRFLCAFDTPTGLPYAWINLKVQPRSMRLNSSNTLIVQPYKGKNVGD